MFDGCDCNCWSRQSQVAGTAMGSAIGKGKGRGRGRGRGKGGGAPNAMPKAAFHQLAHGLDAAVTAAATDTQVEAGLMPPPQVVERRLSKSADGNVPESDETATSPVEPASVESKSSSRPKKRSKTHSKNSDIADTIENLVCCRGVLSSYGYRIPASPH